MLTSGLSARLSSTMKPAKAITARSIDMTPTRFVTNVDCHGGEQQPEPGRDSHHAESRRHLARNVLNNPKAKPSTPPKNKTQAMTARSCLSRRLFMASPRLFPRPSPPIMRLWWSGAHRPSPASIFGPVNCAGSIGSITFRITGDRSHRRRRRAAPRRRCRPAAPFARCRRWRGRVPRRRRSRPMRDKAIRKALISPRPPLWHPIV